METGSLGNAPDAANNDKLLRLLKGVPQQGRTARFRCSLAAYRVPLLQARTVISDGNAWEAPLIAEGACEGRIAFEQAGNGGFGYDCLFIPEGLSCSFGEVSEYEKNPMSHRHKALVKLSQLLAKPGMRLFSGV